MRGKRRAFWVAGLPTLLSCSCPVWAVGSSGFSTQFVGARAAGQGNAFVAEADDPSTLFFNPAGLTQLIGTQASIGASLLYPITSRSGEGINDDKMKRQLSAIPNLYATGSLPVQGLVDNKMSFGVGFTSLYGLTAQWAPTSSLRYVTTESKFETININPTLAAKILPNLSVGIGADYVNLIDVTSENQTNLSGANTLATGTSDGSADGTAKLKGSGSGWGYNVGVLYEPLERHSVALSYRSQVKIPIKGRLELDELSASTQSNFNFPSDAYSVDANSSITLPASILAGYAFKLNSRWTFLADYEWTQWNVFQSQDVAVQESDASRLGLITGNGTNITSTSRQWHNTSAIGVGSNYKLSDVWEFRGGYAFFQKTVPNDTFSPDVPDSSIHLMTIGMTRSWGAFSTDVALNGWIYTRRAVSNTVGSNVGASVNGTYTTVSPSLSLNLNYKWG